MKLVFQRSKSGSIFTKLQVHCNTCTQKELCIEILSQPIFSLTMIITLKLVILVWVDSSAPRHSKHFLVLGHLCTWVQRFSRARVMIGNQTFGVLDVLLMSCVPSEVHLGLQTRKILTFMNYSNEFQKETSPHHLSDTVKNFEVWLLVCSKLTLTNDLTSIRSVNFARHIKSIWQTNHKLIPI